MLCTDIQYKEGILEYLEFNSKIDYIIINEDLDGNINTEELINEIKKTENKIKIILTTTNTLDEEKIIDQISKEINNKIIINNKKNNEINNKIINSKINNQENNKKINNEIINKINNQENNKKINNKINSKINNEIINNKNNKINNEIINKKYNEKINVKKVIEEKNININLEKIKEIKNKKEKFNSNKSVFAKKTIPINNLAYSKQNLIPTRKEVISILGPNGIGKSVFSILLAKNIENKKSIIIDFDILNNSIQTLLGIKKYEEKIHKKINKNNLINHNQKINKFIIKTNLNIDLLSGMNLILDPNYKLSYKKMNEVINELKEDYDVIIFDTAPYNFLEYTKEIINLSNKSIFISGANLLELKKSQKLLSIYEEDWNISKDKINIVFNKCTVQSINDEALKEIFRNYNILGKIQLNDYYDSIINKNMSEKSKLHKEIQAIKKQIIKEKYSGISK